MFDQRTIARTELDARRVDLLTEAARTAHFDEQQLASNIERLKSDPELLSRILPTWIGWVTGPRVTDFRPRSGRPGDVVEILGSGFDDSLTDNTVTIGGESALVVAASTTALTVVTGLATTDGPVTVEVGGKSDTSVDSFTVLPYPTDLEDGPPISYQGAGNGSPGELSPTGTSGILVVLVNPSDRVPADPTASRTTVADRWGNARTFYRQASFASKDFTVTVTSNWATLSGNTSDYVDFGSLVQNVKQTALPRLMAEAAQAAVNAGHNLNDFGIMAVVINLNGSFIRAWGGWDQSTFAYDPGNGGTKINITTQKAINLLAVQESANWGRLAHEIGHNIVSVPGVSDIKTKGGTAVFGEDVYASDLVDASAASAQPFDMMGDHDNRPLFSGYFLDTLGWYRPDTPAHDGDIRELEWSRNAASVDLDLVAHGVSRNTVAGRFHLAKIKVAKGLYYYVQVRQRPGGTTQVFDDTIPGAAAPTDGGVIVTRVVTDTNQDNQQSRIITLLHDVGVLRTGQTAVDPARALTITVLNDNVVNRPLVCRVRIAWAQGIVDDPNGAFDLSIDPWDQNCSSPDIWVDRIPTQGSFDKPFDSEGRPEGNGDKPKPGTVNKFTARISNTGSSDASDVKVTFYSVFPPGVGDNGNWAPIVTRTIGSITKNGHFDVNADWVPLVGQHTCLKAYVSAQLGEISGGNNSAQENVFDFEAPAFSPPAPVLIPIAVRNPRDENVVAQMSLKQLPQGYFAQFPHQWVHLRPHEERQFTLVVVPQWDVAAYIGGRETVPTAPVQLHGYLGRQYAEPLSSGERPGSRFSFMGGVLSNVTPKRGTAIEIDEDREREDGGQLSMRGMVVHAGKRDHVTVIATDVATGAQVGESVRTGDDGRFESVIDLRRLAKLAGREPDDIRGDYDVVAEVFASATVAEAVSATLRVTR